MDDLNSVSISFLQMRFDQAQTKVGGAQYGFGQTERGFVGKQREELEVLRIGFRQVEKELEAVTIGFGDKTWSERRLPPPEHASGSVTPSKSHM
ncbi:hypothetical protein Pyn_11313 [Prunus yedoensis var. nudiflora]|uniref:Uncharacterized protein n=1 Tax=Prunus yedoensis var. nudiflora TaxID=2094558 RepID=A0A314Y3V8_PRUYE|nr:hypothetical protein Pyn_11313 [Prunus yedoensis var. nudiflora]